MSTRVTVKDVRARYRALCDACALMGMDVSKWSLQEGSSTYGRAYRLYDDGRGVLGLSQGFLGLTASEACRALEIMLGVLWSIKEHTRIVPDQAVVPDTKESAFQGIDVSEIHNAPDWRLYGVSDYWDAREYRHGDQGNGTYGYGVAAFRARRTAQRVVDALNDAYRRGVMAGLDLAKRGFKIGN